MDTKELLDKGLEDLRTLGAEVGKAARDAGAEARENWKKLQPHIEKAEKVASARATEIAHGVGESAGELIADARTRLEALRERIRKQREQRESSSEQQP
ncbi:hypothetical protein PPSIR1_35632 [Plesiocystis pacifica SIR-1]|uniref:Uncharacterized protein n=1 Tax=Plesiocystis pacifica SIR-1 TaxID=391625 RepID=A6G1Q5_9BACT|nr:hypothetical protein [Plesiocystis pacifica]EDM80095.1 hypothetical protein PPSIR1_35632 [Plesiocystis pacifica SIR-1]